MSSVRRRRVLRALYIYLYIQRCVCVYIIGGKTCSPLFPANDIYINGLLIFLPVRFFPFAQLVRAHKSVVCV